jgi:hypothetical protein
VTTPLGAASALTLTLTAVTLGYAFACWVFPFRACGRCHGLGKRRSPSGRTFRYCRRCKGTGARLRVGRWIYNHLTRIRKEGTR